MDASKQGDRMALPKAILYQLGKDHGDKYETPLRSAGFATAVVNARELNADARQWMQLTDVMNDESVLAMVVAGNPEDFSLAEKRKISLLNLSLTRKTPLINAVVSPDGAIGGDDSAPGISGSHKVMDNLMFFKPGEPFGAKIMATRFKPARPLELPFTLRCYADPLIGLWFEIAPPEGSGDWSGFMAGIFDAELNAFGVGPAGVLPKNSTLAYPMLGIKGDINGREFSACAAQNRLDAETSCFCRVEGVPGGIFVGPYPDPEKEDGGFCYEAPVSFDW